jgi:hypothetical protein
VKNVKEIIPKGGNLLFRKILAFLICTTRMHKSQDRVRCVHVWVKDIRTDDKIPLSFYSLRFNFDKQHKEREGFYRINLK